MRIVSSTTTRDQKYDALIDKLDAFVDLRLEEITERLEQVVEDHTTSVTAMLLDNQRVIEAIFEAKIHEVLAKHGITLQTNACPSENRHSIINKPLVRRRVPRFAPQDASPAPDWAQREFSSERKYLVPADIGFLFHVAWKNSAGEPRFYVIGFQQDTDLIGQADAFHKEVMKIITAQPDGHSDFDDGTEYLYFAVPRDQWVLEKE